MIAATFGTKKASTAFNNQLSNYNTHILTADVFEALSILMR